MAKVMAEIRAEFLPSTSAEGCDCTDLLDNTSLCCVVQLRQNRECTYDVIFRHVRLPIVAVQEQSGLRTVNVSL